MGFLFEIDYDVEMYIFDWMDFSSIVKFYTWRILFDGLVEVIENIRMTTKLVTILIYQFRFEELYVVYS